MKELVDIWEREQWKNYQRQIDEEERLHRMYVVQSMNDMNDYLNQISQNQETIKKQIHFSNMMNLYRICQISAIQDQLNIY